MTSALIFYGFAALTVGSAFFVVFSRNIVHAGFALLFTLFGVAGLYAQLGADFLAVTQVVVYIGGILVLILFAVMMTRIPLGDLRRQGRDHYVPAGILALLVFAALYYVAVNTAWPVRELEGGVQATTAEIGKHLMSDFIFPFEYASLLLLVAMIGAALLIREGRPTESSASAGDEGAAAVAAEAAPEAADGPDDADAEEDQP